MAPENPSEGGPKYAFEKGMRVRLRKNVSKVVEDIVKKDFGNTAIFEVYDVVPHTDEGGDAIYIGIPGTGQSIPVSHKHLEPVTN